MNDTDTSPEQQPGESAKAYAAFLDYCRLGAGRSLAKLHQTYTKPAPELPPTKQLRTLKQWSADRNWQERVKAFDAGENERKRQARDKAIAEMEDRHARIALLAQNRIATSLNAVDILAPETALRYMEIAIRLERQARRMADQPGEINVNIGKQKEGADLADRIISDPTATRMAHDLLARISGADDAPTAVGGGDAGVDSMDPDEGSLDTGASPPAAE